MCQARLWSKAQMRAWPLPAGIRVFCQEERTQAQNKERAFAILRAKLYELELQRQQDEIYAARKSQVRRERGWRQLGCAAGGQAPLGGGTRRPCACGAGLCTESGKRAPPAARTPIQAPLQALSFPVV
jgi:hypothetical protein